MTMWSYRGPICSVLVAFLVLIVDPQLGGVGEAVAQLTPTPLPQTGPGQTDKPKGVAEEAKEGVDKLPTTPVIPQVKSKRKRFELFELNGYYRFRTDWMKNFHLGFNDQGDGGAPFPQALSCQDQENPAFANCSDTLKSANMRLRLEPTINVNETTQVYLQVDVLDNLVLGSSPESLGRGDIPDVGFGDNQSPPETDGLSARDSIRVKRVWAEVETSVGQVSFGRMPWHWGLGIFANSGGSNPFSGADHLDSDFGDTVDRLMFRAQIPGTRIDAAIATDWSSTFPVANHDQLFTDRAVGQPWDLEDEDDVSTWVFMLTRFDKPKIFDEIVARGDLAVNYGGFLSYRTQTNAAREPGDGETLASTLVRRGLKTYTPNAWLKLGKDQYLFELEAVGVLGTIENASDILLDSDPDANDPNVAGELDIRRFGGVARLTYKTLEDKMRLIGEVGFASGDQWDNQPAGIMHVSNARPLAAGGADKTLGNFLFDPDYHVDLILFRELIGTVTNATYVKPTVTYDLTSEITFKGSAIISFANVPVSTPGNSTMYGAEFNGDLGYRSGGFFAGVSYGILFPLGALDHPLDTDGGTGFGFGLNVGDAGNAQTIQSRLMLQF